MRTFSRLVLTLGLVVALAGSAAAQTRQGGQGRGLGGAGGLSFLLRNEAVQKELKMEKEQVEKTTEAIKKVTDKHADEFTKLRDLAAEERRTKTAELNKTVNEETLKAVGEVLKPEQMARLKQIDLQRAGFAAYTQPEVQTALKLTDEQKEKVKTISEEANKQIRELMGMGAPGGGTRPQRGQGGAGGRGTANPNAEKLTALRKETTEKITALMTDDQKATWKSMTGEAFAVPAPTFGRPVPKKDN